MKNRVKTDIKIIFLSRIMEKLFILCYIKNSFKRIKNYNRKIIIWNNKDEWPGGIRIPGD